MNEPAKIRTIELERLVDGELSDMSYQDLLQRLEVTPGGWRRCALLFLEHQMLSRELREELDEWQSADTTMAPHAPIDSNSIPSGRQVSPTVSPINRTMAPPGATSTCSERHDAASWVAALVAACIVGFLAGGVMFPREPNDAARRANADARPTTANSEVDDAANLATSPHAPSRRAPHGTRSDRQPTWPVFVRNAERDDQGRPLVPAYRPDQVEQVDQAWSQTQNMLDRSLANYGGQVRRRWQFKPVVLDDGTQIVLPIEHVELLPRSEDQFTQ